MRKTLLSLTMIAALAVPGVAQARHGADDGPNHARHASHARHHHHHHHHAVRHHARGGADDGANHR
jgi:hypothetical protein